jgi:hypothetical protein
VDATVWPIHEVKNVCPVFKHNKESKCTYCVVNTFEEMHWKGMALLGLILEEQSQIQNKNGLSLRDIMPEEPV